MELLIEKSWCVYMLKCADNTVYTGATNDLWSRLIAHNEGRAAKYTRGRGPVQLLAVCHVKSRSAALMLEHEVKQLSRQEKLRLVDTWREETAVQISA